MHRTQVPGAVSPGTWVSPAGSQARAVTRNSDEEGTDVNQSRHRLKPATRTATRPSVLRAIARRLSLAALIALALAAVAPASAFAAGPPILNKGFAGGEETGATYVEVPVDLDPNGYPTEWKAEYATSSGTCEPPAVETGCSWTLGASGTLAAGEKWSSHHISISVPSPETQHYVRVEAKNSAGEATPLLFKRTTESLCPFVVFFVGIPANSPSVTSTSALLRAQIKPHLETDWRFEYLTRGALEQNLKDGKEAFQGASVGASGTLVADEERKEIEAELTGLSPSTVYYTRLKAKNSAGEDTRHNIVGFKTLGPPTVETSTAYGLYGATPRPLGSVDAGGYDTRYHFEYLSDAAYQANLQKAEEEGKTGEELAEAAFEGAASTPEVDIGAGSAQTESGFYGEIFYEVKYPSGLTFAGQNLPGLEAGAKYRFRIAAHNALGGVHGEERSLTAPTLPTEPAGCPNDQFRTGPSALLPDCRAYEQVTPADKGSQDLFAHGGSVDHGIPAEDGERFGLSTGDPLGSAPGSGSGPNGSGHAYGYFFTRAATGWQVAGTYPPEAGQSGYQALALTPDLTRIGVLRSEFTNAYAHAGPYGVLAGPPGGPYATLAEPAVDQSFLEAARGAADTWIEGGDPSLGKVVFFSLDHSLDPAAASSVPAAHALYEASAAGVRLLQVDDAGQPLNPCGAVLGAGYNIGANFANGAISTNGSRVFFTSPPPVGQRLELPASCEESVAPPQLYARIDGSRTIEVSAPEAGMPASNAPASYQGASANGSRVFFTTTAELTADDAGIHDEEALRIQPGNRKADAHLPRGIGHSGGRHPRRSPRPDGTGGHRPRRLGRLLPGRRAADRRRAAPLSPGGHEPLPLRHRQRRHHLPRHALHGPDPLPSGLRGRALLRLHGLLGRRLRLHGKRRKPLPLRRRQRRARLRLLLRRRRWGGRPQRQRPLGAVGDDRSIARLQGDVRRRHLPLLLHLDLAAAQGHQRSRRRLRVARRPPLAAQLRRRSQRLGIPRPGGRRARCLPLLPCAPRAVGHRCAGRRLRRPQRRRLSTAPVPDCALRRRCLPHARKRADRPDTGQLRLPGARQPQARSPPLRQGQGEEERQVREEGAPQEAKAPRRQQEGKARPPRRSTLMRRAIALPLALACLALGGLLPAPAQADIELKSFALSSTSEQAGAYPDMATSFRLLTSRQLTEGNLREVVVDLPPGFAGDPLAAPTCTAVQLARSAFTSECPVSSQVGTIELGVNVYGSIELVTEPLYNMVPPPGAAAALGFNFSAVVVQELLVTVVPGPAADPAAAHLRVTTPHISGSAEISRAKVTVWGVPADPSHDAQRDQRCYPSGCRGGGVSFTGAALPFFSTPTACTSEALTATFRADSWQQPDRWIGASAPIGPMSGCERLHFSPSLTLTPTTDSASSPSGLEADLEVPQSWGTPGGFATSHLKKAVVTLPEGFSINPSAGSGLGVCTEAQYESETASSPPGAGCPNESKIGTVEVETPVLEEKARGALYVAKPYDNPFGSLLALYLVAKIPERSVIVEAAGKVEPDPVSGRLTTSFDQDPQLPFSHLELRFNQGATSPLVSPPACGTYAATGSLTPWAAPDEAIPLFSSLAITRGVGGGECPSGGLPSFKPGLAAGTLSNAAGTYSPFHLRLSRSDGEQEITHFSIKLPPGVLGKLAGIPFCPDAAIAAAKARTGPNGGEEELEQPSCPQASEIGRTLVGAGVGQVLAWAPGKVYLAGPYHGSALSVVAVTDAKVGPFDLGTVVVREALRVNPETAEVFVDATGSDPIPHIIDGIPTHLRDIRVYMNRPEFVLNPTSCEPTSTASTVLGSGLDFASEADDVPVTVTSRFQAADCAALPFHPKLALRLLGGTRRGAHPRLKAVLRMNGIGEAAISRAQVTLPRSEFLDQGHLNNICTRVQFREGEGNGANCPRASVYGWARARTPILSEPLEGPVFLRSSEHHLPDLVAALHSGEINIDLDGRIDSLHGQIRNTFEAVPDAPVSSFTLEMRGGSKGLLVNSTSLCKGKHRAIVNFDAHNGKIHDFTPELGAKCTKPHKKGKGKHRHRRTP